MRNTLVRLPDLLPAPSHEIGPTWRRLADGSFYLPEKSLGWGRINWIVLFLRNPEDTDLPFLPTLEQSRFVIWWYALDARGKFAYRNGILRRLKGWGKDPIVAAISLAELCGPVAFSHWNEDGNPVGKRRTSAWIQIAAVSQDQTRTTFSLFPSLISDRLKSEFGLDVNKTIIYSAAGGMIEAVTSSPLALEGKRPTLVILNEVQWWFEANQGHEMYSVIEGNVTKRAGAGSRFLAICNAHRPGEDSIGERLWENYQTVQGGQAIDTGIMYDALEAPADTPVSEIPDPEEDPEGFAAGIAHLRAGLEVARGDAVWLDIDALISSILDINNPITESRRKYLNQINASEDAWVAPNDWDNPLIRKPELKLQPKDRITLGFDGSKSQDHTALVACRVEDGALFVLRHWNPERFGGEIPREDVDAVVRSAFARYDVVAFRADVREFEAYVDQWGRDFKSKLKVNASPAQPVAFDMRGQKKKFALDCERFLDAIAEASVLHTGDTVLRQHVLNAHRRPTTYDAITIGKASKDSSRKIDVAICAVLAYGARHEFLMSSKNYSRKVAVYR